jgi:hypothetical protein
VDNPDFTGSQLGDLSAGNIAGTIYNVSSEQAIRMLANDLQATDGRVAALERAEAHHSNERGAMTRLITMLASEAHTVSEVQGLLERQITSEAEERGQRRRYLDTMLTTLVALSVVNVLFHIYNRVLRRPAGGEAIHQQ